MGMDLPQAAAQKPKILIAASIYPPDSGGPATHAKRQFEGFPELGFEVRLVALSLVRKFPMGIRHLIYTGQLMAHAASCDLIYAHDGLGVGLPALFVAKLFRKKILIRVGGDIPWERVAEQGRTSLSMNEWYEARLFNGSLSYAVSKFVLQRVHALIVPSSLLLNLYSKYYSVQKSKISVVPNPISVFPKDKVSEQSQTIIFASRLVAYKNLPFVLKAMAKVLPNHSSVQFIIMGDGPERVSLEQLTQDLGIGDKIIFTGSVSQEKVVEYTKHCLFGIAPALTEFNPNYILECIAYGKPFLMSRENGLPFNIPQQFLFDNRNSSELESRLEYMLSVEGYRKAKKEVSGINFQMSWDDVLKRNEEIIRSTIHA